MVCALILQPQILRSLSARPVARRYLCMYVCMYACIAQQPLRDEVGAWQNNRKHRLSRRLLVSEAQIDNRQMSTVNCNSTSKDHDIAAWWTSQATAASAVIELPLKASNRRIVATDCTETVLICHERDLFSVAHVTAFRR